MMGYGGLGAMGAFGWIWMVLVWVAVIGVVVWGVGALFGRWHGKNETDALEILRKRYARGEISQAEFEQAKRALV